MHIADVDGGNLGANGIVAGSIPIAAGAALALKQRGSDRVVVCFFGDGAANEGGFHEALNMAATWKLPVIFICENNHYGMSMAWSKAVAIDRLSKRADAYGFPGETVDGNDILEVRGAVGEAVKRARSGEGPSFVECLTYRYKGHSKSDKNLYRTREEISEWRDKDPTFRFARRALEEGWLDQATVDTLPDEAQQKIERAIEEAKNQPEPSLVGIEDEAYA